VIIGCGSGTEVAIEGVITIGSMMFSGVDVEATGACVGFSEGTVDAFVVVVAVGVAGVMDASRSQLVSNSQDINMLIKKDFAL